MAYVHHSLLLIEVVLVQRLRPIELVEHAFVLIDPVACAIHQQNQITLLFEILKLVKELCSDEQILELVSLYILWLEILDVVGSIL